MGCASSQEAQAATFVSAKANRPQSFFEGYVLQEKLGKGAFAQVRRASCRQTGQQLAVKILDIRQADSAVVSLRERRHAEQERDVWRLASQNENIVALKEYWMESGCAFFLMDFCDTNLLNHLRAGAGSTKLNEMSLGRVLSQALLGLAHLHDLSIVHRDVKPDNFMVNNDIVKLTDFGLSAVLGKDETLMGNAGTAPFMAPEMLQGVGYAHRVDIWSLGVMAYVLMFGTYPYMPVIKTAGEMKKTICKGDRLPSFTPHHRIHEGPRVSDCAVEFVQKLLHRNPHHRPDALEALCSTYLQQSRPGARKEEELPSLMRVLRFSEKCGAFEKRDLALDGDLDPLLERLSSDADLNISDEKSLKHQRSNASNGSAVTTVPSSYSSLPSSISRSPSSCPSTVEPSVPTVTLAAAKGPAAKTSRNRFEKSPADKMVQVQL